MAKKNDVRSATGTTGSNLTYTITTADSQAAALVVTGAECLLGAVEIVHFDINWAVSVFPVSMQHVPARERVTGEANADSGWTYAQNQLMRKDFADKPYLRVFGRVMEILLNHRRRQTCTAGDVFRVFLVEIPSQLEENHQQNPPPGQRFNVTEPIGRRTFNNRMRKMCEEELAEPTVTRDAGQDGNYVLTGNGKNMFDGWPDLEDIPGLTYEGPATPEPRPRRRS